LSRRAGLRFWGLFCVGFALFSVFWPASCVFLLFPLLFGLMAVGKPLIILLLTEKWIGLLPYLYFLSLVYLLFPLHMINLQVMNSQGRSDLFLKIEIQKAAYTHKEGIAEIFKMLIDKRFNVLDSLNDISVIGHRIVHGGEKLKKSVLVNEEVKKEIEDCIELSPLHNPGALAGIKACEELAPNIQNVTVFDTAFHQTMPEIAYMYNIPYEMYEKYKIRRYGFHGISHRYIRDVVRELLGEENTTKIITCHIGQGASICAIKDGKSIDTSMGLTPLDRNTYGNKIWKY